MKYQKYNPVTIGLNLRVLRIERNYSQQYVSKRLDITPTAYGKYELGRTQITLDLIFAIARLFAMPCEELAASLFAKPNLSQKKRLKPYRSPE